MTRPKFKLQYTSMITGDWIDGLTYRLKRHAKGRERELRALGYDTRIVRVG